MSIEERLAENTAALKELTAALLAAGAVQTAQASAEAHSSPAVQAVVKAQKAADAKKSTPAADAPAASGEPSAPTGESSSSEPTGELQPWAEKTAKLYGDLKDGEPTLDNLRKAVLGINGMIGREQAEAVLQRFGAQAITPKDNKKGLDAAQYPDAFALCLDVLSGCVDATASMVSE